MLQVAIVLVVGHVLLGVSWPGDWFALAVFVCAGVICFALLGVALSHAIPNPESAPAYVNAVFLPQILIAGVFYDANDAPNIIHDIAQALPLTHLVDGLSGAIVDNEGVGVALGRAARARVVGGDRRRPRVARLFLGSRRREQLTGFARGPPRAVWSAT